MKFYYYIAFKQENKKNNLKIIHKIIIRTTEVNSF